jgi:hypothetical protein
MNRWIRSSVLFAAAAAVPLFVTASAHGQYRVGQDGRALDANNRIGSGGNNPNDSTKRVGEVLNGNDIVTGNVSGGKQFRGQIQYTAPNEFRGNTAGVNMDNFIKQSSGGTNGPDMRLAQDAKPFYGSRAVVKPPGYVETNSGVYIPPAYIPPQPRSDTRVGAVDLSNPNVVLAQPGELLLAGQVDPTAGQTYITASPTAGIRSVNASDFSGMTTNTQYNPVGTRLDQNAIERMRGELNREAGDITGGGQPSQESKPAPGAQPVNSALPGATAIQQQPVLQANASKPVDTAVNAAAAGGVGQGIQNRVTSIPAPEKQSALYAQLLKQYQESLNNPQMTDEERARYVAQLQGQAKKDETAAATPDSKTPNVPQPPDASAGAATPGAADGKKPTDGKKPIDAKKPDNTPALVKQQSTTPEVAREMAAKKQPIKSTSLSEGMKSKQLAEVLQGAEQMMRDGKFTAALDKYDDAERVVPNNPLVNLGRANAELGASYYARADQHLRDLFTNHPELLVAQYDLTAMLGEQRLQTLVRDLKEISKKDQREPRPLFLLSYIAYNTGHENDAAAYLDLADKRTGGSDPFYQLLRKHWTLPAAKAPAPPAEANK